ncbi:Helicase associated domain protein [Actinoplanes sp. G11-F43]|uniref:helicase associated domain-containing protein n=1 Tax=Actinoplanes sp. G11-F43 TaxID=3424130 RepID=UPI003D33C24B
MTLAPERIADVDVALASLSPRPEQIDALTALHRTFALHDRAQLVMACGTGKTLVARWQAETMQAQRTLVFLPSLGLLAQTLAEWRRARGWDFEALVVCSDPSTSAGRAERSWDTDDGEQDLRPYWARSRALVTTSPAKASGFLTRKVDGRPQVVFCTYHSTPALAEALAAAHASFDLAVYDEAHRVAGKPRDEFLMALDARAVPARKRLFMTATPHIVDGDDVVSMDDHHLFGPVAHTISFGAAIAAGRLADYRVLVAVDRGTVVDNHEPTTVPAALLNAIDGHGIRRVLTYHSRVARAQAFADTMDLARSPANAFVRARTVHGQMPAADRADTLTWLGADQDTQVRVVSSARCLTEGIDVPSVDAVMFADKRTSIIDIIQAVGRVLRPAPGKRYGNIIIPVSLPADLDDDTGLALSEFGHVWAVLRGLRAHDQRLAEELDAAVRDGVRRGRRRAPTDRVHFLLPDGLDEVAVQLRLVEEVGSRWEKFYTAATDWAAANPGRRISATTVHHGCGIGSWAAGQRRARTKGVLTVEVVERLEQIPGWYWDRDEADWDDTYQLLQSYGAAHGTVADNPTGDTRFAKVYSPGLVQWRLGVWAAMQRQLHRDGMLDGVRVARLEELPGWDWNAGLREQDVAMVQALRLFCDFEKHADVPEDHRENGLPLGRWVWAVRRANLLGQVPPALVDELTAACPRDVKGNSLWRWEQPEARWRLAYAALRQYVDREQRLPTGHTAEDFAGTSVKIAQWAARQRFLHRRAELDARYAGWLEAIPGWQWERPRGNEFGEPIDLGGKEHGGGSREAMKCPCEPCVGRRRASQREWIARKQKMADPVPANRAAAHVARLESAGCTRGMVVAASAVPLGVIRKVVSGEWTQLEREHEQMLLATTVEACHAVQSEIGSRGRTVSPMNRKVDVAPTRALLDDLAARGFGNGWVSRELGYARGGLQIAGARITARLAEQVADLHQRVGDLRYPRQRHNTAPPRLAELLAMTGETS